MSNIYLVGLPGSGKTTIGKLFAKKLNKKFVDLDKYIVNREEKTISMLFEEGEEVFRKAETDSLKEIIENFNDYIVATGGGVVETPENIELLKKQPVIYLYRPIPLILSTLNAEKRPLLKNNPDKLYEIWRRRKSKYEEVATFKVRNNRGFRYCVDKLLKINLDKIC
ncbi:MAG: shikimate kinase [Clostridia bacterium]|jgi:shikimate kinase|nr:shikimate kinase [Clostridia bacterium]